MIYTNQYPSPLGAITIACDEEAIVAVTGKLPKLPKKLTKVGKF